jgi:hypothetical protein
MLVFGVVTPCGLAGNTNVSEKQTASIVSSEDGCSMSLRNVGIYLQVFRAEDGDSMFLRNVGIYLQVFSSEDGCSMFLRNVGIYLQVFRAEDGDSMFLRNVGIYLQVKMETVCFSETSVSTYKFTRRNKPRRPTSTRILYFYFFCTRD